MSRLLRELENKTSLADVQRGGPGNLASKDGTPDAGKDATPGTTPGTPTAEATGNTTGTPGASPPDIPLQGSGQGSMPASQQGSQEGGKHDSPQARKPRRKRAGTNGSMQDSQHDSMEGGLAASLQSNAPRTIVKRTFDVDVELSDRIDAAVKHFGRGSLRKIVHYAFIEILEQIGF